MKTIFGKSTLALAVIAAIGLSACNDNSNESTSNPTTPAAVINKTTSGVITGFGSIFINGVEYETDSASFVVDGVEGDESLLKLGMVVTLSGDAAADGTGEAIAVEFENEVEGIVIDNSSYPVDGTLNIMGLTIHTDEDTVFESSDETMISIADVLIGNVIEVSGYSSGAGNVWATRLEVKKSQHDEGDEIEMKGLVSLPITDSTFMIGDLLVNYDSAEFDDMTSDMLAEDLLLEVKSEVGFNERNELIASKIELKNSGKKEHRYEDDDEEVEVQGVITAVTSTTKIEINGATVVLSDQTKMIHGSASTLMVGLKVKAKGSIDADGNFVAEKLVFKPSGDIKMQGKIEATDIVNNTITLFGHAITINNYTMVEDDRDDVEESDLVKYNFGVDDLAMGDWVEIKAFKNVSGGLTALKLERETWEEGDADALEGRIESVDAVALTMSVSGVMVNYSSLEEFVPEVNMKAELEGNFADGLFTASEGEAETDDEVYIGGSDADEDDERDEDENENDDDSAHDEDGESENDDTESDDSESNDTE